MFRNLRARLIFYFALAISLSLILSGLLAGSLIRLYIRETAIAELKHEAQILSAESREGKLPPLRILKVAERILRTRVFFIPAPKVFRFPDFQAAPGLKTGLPRNFSWERLAEGQSEIRENYRSGSEEPVVLLIQPVFRGERLLGALILTKPLKFYGQTWIPITRRLLFAGVISLTFSIFLALYLARRLAFPLKKIALAAKAIAKGDYEQKVEVASDDEIGELATTFNYMAEQVKRADQLQKDFVASISHELKTPLTSIQGFTEALLDKTAETAEQKEKSLKIILSQSKRLERLIRDLLDLARIDARQFSLTKRKIDLKQLLNQCYQFYQRWAEKNGIEMKAEWAALPEVYTDGGRLQQIICNLLENALKFTPSGGRVLLRSKAQNGVVFIEVADTGRGISPEDLPHIFDRFYFVKHKGKAGTGLGLAISSELATALGGKITVASREGQGSTFQLQLPLS